MNKSTHQQEIISFIRSNPVAVVGTIGLRGEPHGAAVYVCYTAADHLYFVTKTETRKFKDIVQHPAVSVTIVDPVENASLQATGQAHIVNDAQTIELIMGKLAKIYATNPDWLPPIAKLRAGPYQVVGITITYARLAQFKGRRAGSDYIFTENGITL